MARQSGHDPSGKFRRDAGMAADGQRKANIVKSAHMVLLHSKIGKAVARHLRQRPDIVAARRAPLGHRHRRGDGAPLRGVLRLQDEAREIFLRLQQIAEPRGHRGHAALGARNIAGNRPVIIFQLQHIEGGRRPADRHIGPLRIGRVPVQHRGQIDQEIECCAARLRPYRIGQGGGGGRQHRARLIQHGLLLRGLGALDVGDRHDAIAKGRPGRAVIKADAPVRHDPPPWLANLEADGLPGIALDGGKGPAHRAQIAHRGAMRGREQGGGRVPARQRRIAIFRALLPVVPAMRIEQLVTEREDRLEPHGQGARRKIAMPGGAWCVQRAARQTDIQALAQRLEPEIMAHPHIMVDDTAIAEGADLAQQPFGALIIGVVIPRRHAQGMFGQHGFGQTDHRPLPIAGHVADLHPALRLPRQMARTAGIEGRHQ